MDRLWAPWRMEYIKKAKQKKCFLCEAIQSNDDRAYFVIKRAKSSIVLMNRYPYNSGHLLIAPYRHSDNLSVLTKEELSELMLLASEACEILRRAIKPDGFNLGINLGTVAGAGLKDHIHIHVVPRWQGDTNFMPVLSESKVMSQELGELWQLLRNTLQ